ncbi:MAG: hypothetical protein EXX96DRAFT_506141 [Benjaminiella poitrasii]|nr:MAG: hypothetical protein EXX96DRAFT_506141 [Benjaminiella poitrasii]
MSPDTKLIASLVNRLLVRLPSNSGKKLEVLENDPLINQTVAALIELSKFRLPTITITLQNLLDSIKMPSNEENFPYENLQSQLFVLRLLSACMQHHWQYVRDAKSDAISARASSVAGGGYESSIHSLDSSTYHSRWSVTDGPLPIEIEDPPPLDDAIAKNLINIISRIMHQTTLMEEREYGQATNHVTQITRTEYYTASNITKISADIVLDIYKASSRVIAYLSASNWSVVFSRIKMRIVYLATTNDENPETSDMRLLECCSLNSKRLCTVLSELCTNFSNLKKSTQLIVAAILRRAIWGWIETYPGEFMQLCQSQKKLDGGPDVLFEICLALADTTRKKAILWPLQTMLLILCPDILYSSTNLDNHRNVNSKKALFLATLKSSLKPGRMAELAAICYVDICKATTYVSKSDPSALRNIVPDVEHELRVQLFDPEKPLIADSLMSGLGIIIDHRSLLADCLVAMFRLNPRHTLRNLFPACLDQRAPTLFKISLVKACLAIASEENRLPWNPSVTALYDSLSGPLKSLFIEFASKDYSKMDNTAINYGTNSRKPMISNPANDKKAKKDIRVDPYSERLELILDMLRLYQTDPKLAIRGDNNDRFEKNAVAMVAITNCLREQNQFVRDAAAMCLFKLHQPSYILEWSPAPHFMDSFWKISSQVVFALAKQLLDTREKDDGLKRLLELLKKLFESRNEFLRMHQDIAGQGSDTRERLQASIGLEVALLVLLCSSDIEICSSAITCFGYICAEAQLTECIDDPHQAILMVVENLPIYQQLSANNGIVTGRKSQQKQIRKLLRIMTHYAPGNLAAWEEVYKRWKYMTPAIMKPQEELKDDLLENTINNNNNTKRGGSAWHDKLRNPTSSSNRQTHSFTPGSRIETNNLVDDDKFSEWQNYAGFLAALGGICLMADTVPTTAPTSPTLFRNATSCFGDQAALRRISAPNESSAMVNKFVIEMIDLLLCDNIIIREWIKEILGTDLSPALYPMLFRYMETVLTKYFGTEGDPVCNVRNTLFVEQAINVLKLVLDRMEDSPENLLTVDLGSLIDQYAKYLNKLGSGQSALKIKIKFCQLTEVLMTKKDKVTLRQEFRLRNKLLEIIVEWTSDFSLKPDTINQSTSFGATQSEKLHRELDLACLNTIVSLLHQLPLQSADPVHEADPTPIKSRIFYKYFTFFLKLLNRCRDSETEAENVPHRVRQYAENGVHSAGKNKDNISTYLAPLKESTILAMSNLLSANVDIGLKYSLSMGYHDDTQMRTAFMKVLTNILNQGTEFETLAETVITDRYEKLVDMLVDLDLNIALSLCDVCPASDIEDAANALLACFASRGKVLVLLKAVIQREVQNTDSEAELLRRTSIATRLLSVFAKQNGADYVRSVLQPVFTQLAAKPAEEKTFELDSSKVGNGENVQRNKQNVVSATELFLNAICASANEAPRAFREVCHCILTSVRERYPEAKYTAVGAFIFLRFFCPAIVSPESEGLVKSNVIVSRDMRRGHLIATKVIQNLANNVLFGAKETYMIVLNDFLTSNIYKVTSFLREISNVSPKSAISLNNSILGDHSTNLENSDNAGLEIRQMEEKDYSCLHRVLFDNMERISREVATKRLKQYPDQESATMWKRQFDKFSNLLAQLGRPPETSKQEFGGLRSYTFAAANQLYAEFMRRNSHRSVEAIVSKNIFYEGGISKANRPVFYFIARNIIADSIDFELLVYHILQTIRHNKRRLEMAKPNSISERTIRPNDVPGRLLNMALLNIGSNDPSLRLAAYNLLYTLSITFHFEVGNQLLDARDLCLPANSTTFVVNISEKIAQNQQNLTLEFLSECFIGFQKSSEPLRYLCLDYMIPWLPNLSMFCQNSGSANDKDITKTREVLRNLIDLTVARTEMYKLVQAKVWKTIGQIDDVLNLVLDSFIQFSIEHNVGSPQAEAMADTFVTLSNIAVRGKVVTRLRKVLQKTSFKPSRSLTEHWIWNEIAILIRFVLMLSFNNRGPVKSYVPEIFHIVSLVVGVGPTIIRASVHGLVVNMIQSLCTTMPIQEANVKKLQLILSEISDTKYRLLFGLFKPHANAFTISPETLTDTLEPIPLIALETIVNNLLEVITYGAPSPDMANAWRARWMSLVASTAFQFNPATQPQAFVVLGCLGKEEVDDDLLYQILVALRGALAIFNESDPNLVLSIMMCLKNIVESLPSDSRYLLPLFWIAIALVEINNGPTFSMAVGLLLSILRALDADEYFTGDRVVDILLAAREPIADVAKKLDQLCGVNFESHFSFAISSIFLKGLRYNNAREVIFHGLTTFLDIECKHADNLNLFDSQTLGYLAGLLPLAVKNEALKEVLRLAGLTDPNLDVSDDDEDDNSDNYKSFYGGVFDRLDISDDTTALLLISMLATQLQMAENNNEKLFLYGLLAEAANSIPEVFSVVYDSLLPKMNQIVLSSTSQSIIESVKSILLIACSNPAFSDVSRKANPSQKMLLERVGFSALGDPTFGATSINALQNAKLASEIIELVIA